MIRNEGKFLATLLCGSLYKSVFESSLIIILIIIIELKKLKKLDIPTPSTFFLYFFAHPTQLISQNRDIIAESN